MTGSTGGSTTGSGPVVFGEAVYQEFVDCSASTQSPISNTPTASCPAPLICAADGQLGTGFGCEFPCLTNADCPNPQTICLATTNANDSTAVMACQPNGCDPNQCPPVTGSLNPSPTINGICNVASATAADGTCLPVALPESSPSNGNNVIPLWACSAAGTATTSCFWPGPLSTPATTCPQNMVCNAPLAPQLLWNSSQSTPPALIVGQCQTLCDPDGGTGAAACPAGSNCIALNAGGVSNLDNGAGNPSYPVANPISGACLLDGGSGCNTGLGNTEYVPCAGNGDCACPQTCTMDPNLNIPVCEVVNCAVDADCPTAGDTCIAVGVTNVCQPRFCSNDWASGPNDAGGTINGSCTVVAGDDGVCVPAWNYDAPNWNLYGVCYPTGTATTTCDPAAGANSATLCGAGSTCVAGQCATLCDPTAPTPSTCGTNIACVTLSGNGFAGTPSAVCGATPYPPPEGVCLGACLPVGVLCINNGDCCAPLTCSSSGELIGTCG